MSMTFRLVLEWLLTRKCKQMKCFRGWKSKKLWPSQICSINIFNHGTKSFFLLYKVPDNGTFQIRKKYKFPNCCQKIPINFFFKYNATFRLFSYAALVNEFSLILLILQLLGATNEIHLMNNTDEFCQFQGFLAKFLPFCWFRYLFQ